jgi:hypothetical protein
METLSAISENSSINEKHRKLYIKIHSLISSAQNFETLKLYEDSLKHFAEANDLVKSLSKKSIIEDNLQIRNFFSFFDTHVKSKIKILEQLVNVKNYSEKNKNFNQKNTNSQTSSFDIKEEKVQIKNDPINNDNIEILKNIENILKCCESNLKEIDDIKKTNLLSMNNSIDKSVVLEATIINQNSFYLPNYNNKVLLSPHKSFVLLEESQVLLDKIEEKFRAIYSKLSKMKIFYETEKNLKEKKKLKQAKLENLKNSYTGMKKIYETHIRNGMKFN